SGSSRHARNKRVWSALRATVNAPSASISSPKYACHSLSRVIDEGSTPRGSRQNRIFSVSNSHVLWVESIRRIGSCATLALEHWMFEKNRRQLLVNGSTRGFLHFRRVRAGTGGAVELRTVPERLAAGVD